MGASGGRGGDQRGGSEGLSAFRDDPGLTIGGMISRRGRLSPDRPFWAQGEARLSYGELDASTDRAAVAFRTAAFRGAAVAAEAHAAIFASNGPAYLCAHYGAAKAGLTLAHLNARFGAAEVAHLADHCAAGLLIFGSSQLPVVEEARKRLPRVRQYVLLPEGDGLGGGLGGGLGAGGNTAPTPAPAPSWAVPWEEWIQTDGQSGRSPADAALDPGQPFQLLYTSGTTGAPKGALISHRAKLRQGTTHALNLDLGPGDRVLSSLPLYHQFAQWLVLASVPLTGAAVVARPSFDAGETWRLLAAENITHLPAVPTMLYRMLDVPLSSRPPVPRLRCIVYGGAPMDPARIAGLREAFPGVRLFQGFGQTETGYCLGLLDEDHERHPDSLGRPDPNSQVRLLDEAGREVAPGEVGEIVARTPYLMNGYHNNPEATAAYFAHGPDWGRTGDLAWKDMNGFFFLAGRKDDLVISGGVNIHPAEVERVLSAHPAVAEAAVFGVPDPDWGEILVAAILPGEGEPAPAAEQLQRHCRASLADFKCPRAFHLLDSFPRTANGKVQKFLLRERVTGGELVEF